MLEPPADVRFAPVPERKPDGAGMPQATLAAPVEPDQLLPGDRTMPEPPAPAEPATDLDTTTNARPSLTPAAPLPAEMVIPPAPSRYIIPPRAPTSAGEEERSEISMLKVVLRSTGDKQRDVRRLRRIHGLLRSSPGKDKFALLVFEGSNRYLLEFPNDTTGITSELLAELTRLLGEGNVLVETIPIQ
jgi:DNA polymerase-3 subunit alpha